MEPREFTLANARLVLADSVVESGWVTVADGVIADYPGVADYAGDPSRLA